MPLPIIAEALVHGISAIPYAWPILKTLPWIILIVVLKSYFGGARNKAERVMHSKVVLLTGGTSGIGAAIARDLATRGAQIILLTQHAPSDPFLVEYIDDLRTATNNHLIYAEQVDLSSLHSIRTFATKWVDNSPPRRLDMLILCANVQNPQPSKRTAARLTVDGVNEEWGINYLANFHLLSILSPALRAQPADRDVRVIFGTCSSYIGATLDLKRTEPPVIKSSTGSTSTTAATSTKRTLKQQQQRNAAALEKKKPITGTMYGMSKLALMTFAQSFQKHLDAYERPDKHLNNARVFIVDPGQSRTPGMRRWLTGGSLWGLFAYLTTWPLWWLILKSPEQGAESFLCAAMDGELRRISIEKGAHAQFIKECGIREFLRREVQDEKVGKDLWEFSQKQVEAKEKESAVRRALAKKEKEELKKTQKEAQQEEKEKQKAAEREAGSSSTSNKAPTAGSRRTRKAN